MPATLPVDLNLLMFDHPILLSVVIFVLLLLAVEIGFRIATGASSAFQEAHREQAAATRDNLGVLLSLLLGFTLAMALPRFDLRRQLAIDEANAIGTSVLRAQLLPEPARSRVHDLLVQYADARIDFATAKAGDQDLAPSVERTNRLQAELWEQGRMAAEKNPNPIIALFVASLGDVFDLSEKQLAGVGSRIPVAIWIMLILLSVLTCITVGYCAGIRFWMVWIVTPLMIAIVIWLIADLNSPRTGLIRAEIGSLIRLRDGLHSGAPQNQK